MNKIRVGLDISQTAHPGGVANYTQHLAEQLAKHEELEMVFFYSSLRKPYKGKLKNIKKFKLPPSLFEVLFNKLRNVGIEKFLGPLDIYHSSDWVQPPSKAKKVTTYHDLIPLKFPHWSHPKIVEVHKRRLKLVEQEVDQIICVSESTKKDLLEVSKIPESRITVIYEGVDAQFKPQPKDKVEEFKKEYKLPDEFILAMGGVGERKNLKRIKQAAKGFNLVISGETVEHIPYDKLPLLYSAATVLLYVSLYEGFGLPVLESQSCGTPVITSNTSSMKEIASGSALLVDPTDVAEITQKLKKLISSRELQEDLITKGLKNVKNFSWDKTAQETVAVYKGLMSS